MVKHAMKAKLKFPDTKLSHNVQCNIVMQKYFVPSPVSSDTTMIQKMFLTLGNCHLQSPGSGPRVSLEVMQTGDAVSLVTQHVSGVLFPVTWRHVS